MYAITSFLEKSLKLMDVYMSDSIILTRSELKKTKHLQKEVTSSQYKLTR